MSSGEQWGQWGVGDQAGAKAFRTTYLGPIFRTQDSEYGPSQPIELIHGEHPHSRRDENTYARTASGEILAFSGHHVLTAIELQEHNYLKESELSGDEIRKGGQCSIYYNGQVGFAFFFRDIGDALLRAHRLLIDLPEKAAPYFDALLKDGGNSLLGHKLYFDRTPAVVTMVLPDQGAIVMEPDASAGAEAFPRPVWMDEDDFDDEDRDSVKTGVLDPNIWWHREDKKEQQ